MSEHPKRTVCPLCSLGCGLLIEARGADVQVAGDLAHPINRGSLCARAAMLARSRTSPLRAMAVRYRPAGARSWEQRSWDWALNRIADWLSAGRMLPDRHRPIVFGGAALDCEDFLALAQLAAAANLPHGLGAASVSAAAEAARLTYGIPSFRFAPDDFQQSRTIVAWGANPAESHPIAMRWFLAARDRAARFVVVDPRLTRTAAAADLHVSLCPGTDLALIEALLAEAVSRGAVNHGFLAAHSDGIQSAGDKRNSAPATASPAAEKTPSGNGSLDDRGSVWQQLSAIIRRSPAAAGPADFAERTCGIAKNRFAALCDAFFGDERKPVALIVGNGLAQQPSGFAATRALAVLHAIGGHAVQLGGGWHILGSDANVHGVWRLFNDSAGNDRPRACDVAGREGAIFVGENPAVCTAATNRLLESLDRLRWCVVADLWENETAAFWRRPGVDPSTIRTEVILLPLPHPLEITGTSINATGTKQHRQAILPPIGDARAVRDFSNRLVEAVSTDESGNATKPMVPHAARAAMVLEDHLPASQSPGDGLPPSPAAEHAPTVSFRRGKDRHVWLPLWSSLAANRQTAPVEPPRVGRGEGELGSTPHLPPSLSPIPSALPTDRPVVAVSAGVVRLGEHSLSSVFTRAMPWLVEMAPGPFVELSTVVAAQLGVRQGEMVRVFSASGFVDLPAMVSRRMPAFQVGERRIEQIALVGLFGHCGLAIGPTASSLAPPSDASYRYEIQKAFAAWVCRSDVRRPPNPLQ